MLVKHGSWTFDTDQMVVHETGQMWMPHIYQSACGRHVLLEVYDLARGNKLHYASPAEVRYYAERFALADLTNRRATQVA